MAGLLQQGMAPQGGAQPSPQAQPGRPPQTPQQAPQQPPQGQPGQGGGDPRVDMDPEQGPQQRDQLVNAMLESLYGPMLEQVKRIFQQHQDSPEKAIGRILAQLVTVTWKSLADQGKAVPPGVLVQAAMVAAQAVGEMAIRMGLLPEDDGDTIEVGFMIGMAEFGKASAEQMPPEQRKRFAELIGAIKQGKERAMGGGQGQGQPQGQPSGRPGPGGPPQGGGGQPRQPEPRQGGM